MDTQLRLTPEPSDQGRPPSTRRLSAAARRTGQEGVAMARRELHRARQAVEAEHERQRRRTAA